jgi:hypothetical protein
MTQQDPNKNPNADPNKKPDQNPDSPSADLKPLTEEEMASMTTEEITAHAEKLEAQIKGGKKQSPDQIRENQVRRALKAQERFFNKDSNTDSDDDDAPQGEKPVAQGDLLTLAKTGFELGSDKQKVLQWYVESGRVKTYAEALNHPAVKAELEAIDAESNAAAVIDENDPDDVKLRTKKEAIANARATGEVPEDPEIRKALVEDNLSNMSALR